MGLGMGLVMSPMSTAAMNSVQVAKAGVAGGILSMSRMVGGTFGVAAVGALFQQISDNRLESRLSDLPADRRLRRPGSWTTSAPARSRRSWPSSTRRPPIRSATRCGTPSSQPSPTSLKLSAAVAAVGVAVAVLTIEGKPLRRRVPREVAAAAAAVD